jgi:hypothetical protein
MSKVEYRLLRESTIELVFAREITGPLTKLMKQLDAEVDRYKTFLLKAVVVLLSDDDGMERALREIGRRQGIRMVSLSVLPDGPKQYPLSPEADVTGVLYWRHQVAANHVLRKGELNEKAVRKILANVVKRVPDKD